MKKVKTKLVEEKYYNGRQSVEYVGIYKLGVFKLRIRIDIDSVDFQSGATIKVWSKDTLQWNFLASIHSTKMASRRVFAYRKILELTPDEKTHIKCDIHSLLESAKKILL